MLLQSPEEITLWTQVYVLETEAAADLAVERLRQRLPRTPRLAFNPMALQLMIAAWNHQQVRVTFQDGEIREGFISLDPFPFGIRENHLSDEHSFGVSLGDNPQPWEAHSLIIL